VLYRNHVERAVDSALEQAESVLDIVGVNVAHRIATGVIDNAVGTSTGVEFRRDLMFETARYRNDATRLI
jgi:hypothetical protein